MKFLVVVLALAAACVAEPEADPAYFYNSYYGHPSYYRGYYGGYGYPSRYYGGYRHFYKRDADAEADPQLLLSTPAATAPLLPYANAFNYNLYNPYVAAPFVNTVAPYAPVAPVVAPAPAPVVQTVVAAPAPIVRTVAPVPVPVAGPLPGHDCVTPGGCAALHLRAHGLAKRDADADADAYYYNNFYNPYTYSPYAYNPYYNQYNAFYNHNAFYNAYNYNGVYPYAAPAPIAAPVVKALPVAAPVPVVKALPAPVPVVKAAPVVAAPLPIVRTSPPVVAPIVRESVKPVTYTHIGKHPLRTPATILEKKTQVVGHTVY